ncbi:hypothetical protein [Brucella sp. IR073]|uniref:hypothetical protein n=1 Tax=unclassified Brucella TaxID=2632610 RepID=UPI003B984E05
MIPPTVLMKMATIGLTEEQARAVAEMLSSVEQATKDEVGHAIEARRASDRERKARQRHGMSRDVTGQDVTACDMVSPKKETSPTPPKEKITPSTTSEANASSVSLEAEFEQQFWPAYPRKVGKGQAIKAYRSARKQADLAEILTGLRRYADERRGENPEFTKHAATWLNGQCWLDEPTVKRAEPPPKRAVSHTDIWAEALRERGIFTDEPDGYERHILDAGDGGGYREGNVHPLRIAVARAS